MIPSLSIRVHHVESFSHVNGPGVRTVIWTQGCDLHCHGCFNPATHDMNGGYRIEIEELADQILSHSAQTEGITISGGEPLLQIPPLTALVELIRNNSKSSIILYSGFTWGSIQQLPDIQKLLDNIDVLLAGPYIETHRVASAMVGSSNKTLHFLTQRYQESDFNKVSPAEVIITSTGEIHFCGIDPIQWQK